MEDMKQLCTEWGKNLNKEAVLQEYPRPTLKRDSYLNLNGEWDYSISEKDDFPEKYDGKILVPFSPEAPLSGVNRQLEPDQYLYYRKKIILTEEFCHNWNAREKRGHLLLHFGAVDQECLIYVNHHFAGAHVGGYLPFTLNITRFATIGENEIQVVVKDMTDESYHSRGKQKLEAGGMFYTAQSGIWQTVWMEYVPELYIKDLKIQPLYDKKKVRIKILTNEKKKKKSIEVQEIKIINIEILKDGELIQEDTGFANQNFEIDFPEFESWTPENPVLYQVRMQIGDDRIESYFAMRKVSVDMDEEGIWRFWLNNELYFQNGVLDQGYWPEGLYTAPSDEAMISDIRCMKELGFNMLRKHVKIEPERWYYHCDRLGMLVWQDMVNGGEKYHMTYVCKLPTAVPMMRAQKDNNYNMLARTNEEGQKEYIKELRDTVRFLYNHPCIVTWVPFNEGWGQFEAAAVTELLRRMDPTRCIDQASGWFDQGGGDYFSIHNYFRKLKVKPRDRVVALTEYGGYSCRVEGHSCREKVYGYKKFETTEELTDGLELLIDSQILPAIPLGLSVTVLTQLSDIEEEVNGLLTYDRAQLKVDADRVKKWNQRIYDIFANPDLMNQEDAGKSAEEAAEDAGESVESAGSEKNVEAEEAAEPEMYYGPGEVAEPEEAAGSEETVESEETAEPEMDYEPGEAAEPEEAADYEPEEAAEPEVDDGPEETAEPELDYGPGEAAEPEEAADYEQEEAAEPEVDDEPEETAEPEMDDEPGEAAEPEMDDEPEDAAEPNSGEFAMESDGELIAESDPDSELGLEAGDFEVARADFADETDQELGKIYEELAQVSELLSNDIEDILDDSEESRNNMKQAGEENDKNLQE